MLCDLIATSTSLLWKTDASLLADNLVLTQKLKLDFGSCCHFPSAPPHHSCFDVAAFLWHIAIQPAFFHQISLDLRLDIPCDNGRLFYYAPTRPDVLSHYKEAVPRTSRMLYGFSPPPPVLLVHLWSHQACVDVLCFILCVVLYWCGCLARTLRGLARLRMKLALMVWVGGS